MNDERLDRRILDVLSAQTRFPLTVQLVADYATQPGEDAPDPEHVGERLRFMKDRGWVDFKVDDYRKERWFITEAGEIKRKR